MVVETYVPPIVLVLSLVINRSWMSTPQKITDDSLKQWKYYTISLSERNYVLFLAMSQQSRENTFQIFFFHPIRCKPISHERFCETSCTYLRPLALQMKSCYSSLCICLVLPTCCLKSSGAITKEAN